jgi:glycosyltransferase involved in cell wall biosynthesis
MANSQSISVVCPTFNSAAFLTATLEAVMGQTLAPMELILVDDGSSDDTVQVAEIFFLRARKKFDCKLLKNRHRGPGSARNAGIQVAGGDWIAFLDSDDLWLPDKLKVMVEAIALHDDKNFFCHNELRLRLNGKESLLNYAERYRPGYSLFVQLYHSNMFSTSAVICEKKLLLERGGFDETLSSAQDYELWLRLSPHIRPFFVEQVLGRYVERMGNITSGRLYTRMMNEIWIACRHAGGVSIWSGVRRMGRICLSYGWQFLQRMGDR